MKKLIIKAFTAISLVAIMVLSLVTVSFGADITADQYVPAGDLMAHNIYSDPVLSGTSRNFNTYIIDFWGEKTPNVTYWALANFGLSFSAKSKATYPGISGGGAYTGLQTRDKESTVDGKVAILSFWEYNYQVPGEPTKMRATRIYPKGDESNFGGEGEGTNWIHYYPWEDKTWHRLVLHCWEDLETGQTFVGEWICDLSTGEWYLNAYFNTKLYDAKLTGGLGLFQENYVGGVNNWSQEREYRVKNMYVNDAADGLWKSITSTNVSWSKGQKDWTGKYYNKIGGFDFGTGSDADGEYFWGRSGGYVPGQDPNNYDHATYIEKQLEYEANKPRSQKFTISQPDQPTLGAPKIENLSVKKMAGKWQAVWTLANDSTPQLAYKIEILDKAGNVIESAEQTRPEVKTAKFPELDTDDFSCRLTITDVYGASVTTTVESTAIVGPSDPLSDENVKLNLGDSFHTITWLKSAEASESRPYTVEVINENGDVIFTSVVTSGRACIVKGVDVAEFKYRLTTTDGNGEKVVYENTTANFVDKASQTDNTADDNSGLIIGIVVAAVVVIGGAVLLIVFLKKKK